MMGAQTTQWAGEISPPPYRSRAAKLREFSLTAFNERRKHVCSFCYQQIPAESERYDDIRACDHHFRLSLKLAAKFVLQQTRDMEVNV